jgi:hypothetical protein
MKSTEVVVLLAIRTRVCLKVWLVLGTGCRSVVCGLFHASIAVPREKLVIFFFPPMFI